MNVCITITRSALLLLALSCSSCALTERGCWSHVSDVESERSIKGETNDNGHLTLSVIFGDQE